MNKEANRMARKEISKEFEAGRVVQQGNYYVVLPGCSLEAELDQMGGAVFLPNLDGSKYPSGIFISWKFTPGIKKAIYLHLDYKSKVLGKFIPFKGILADNKAFEAGLGRELLDYLDYLKQNVSNMVIASAEQKVGRKLVGKELSKAKGIANFFAGFVVNPRIFALKFSLRFRHDAETLEF